MAVCSWLEESLQPPQTHSETWCEILLAANEKSLRKLASCSLGLMYIFGQMACIWDLNVACKWPHYLVIKFLRWRTKSIKYKGNCAVAYRWAGSLSLDYSLISTFHDQMFSSFWPSSNSRRENKHIFPSESWWTTPLTHCPVDRLPGVAQCPALGQTFYYADCDNSDGQSTSPSDFI